MTLKITIMNEKGGIGKTTTSISLGGVFSKESKKVLLIDLDNQACLTQALGLNRDTVKSTIANYLLGKENIYNIIQPTQTLGLLVVPASSDIALLEQALQFMANSQYLIRDKMNRIEGYDYIIYDCSPVLGPLALMAMVASDLIIIPTQVQYLSLIAAMKNTLGKVSEIQKRYNPNLSFRFLVTMFDQRIKSQQILSDRLKHVLGDLLFETKISNDSKLAESQILGIPISYCFPQSKGALQFQELAEEIHRL